MTAKKATEAVIYYPLGSYTSVREEARKKFLHTIKTKEPEVLLSLSRDVLPKYQKLYKPEFNGGQDYLMSSSIFFYFCLMDSIKENSNNQLKIWEYESAFHRKGIVFFPDGLLPLNQVLYWSDFISAPHSYRSKEVYEYMSKWKKYCSKQFDKIMASWDGTAALELHNALVYWASTWHLSKGWTGWLFDYTLQTLNRWCHHNDYQGLDWVYTLQGIYVEELDPTTSFTFWYSPCDLEVDTWQSYEQKLITAFDVAKKAYRNRTDELMSSKDQTKATNKYKQEHYEWLVLFQLQKWSKNKIAKHYGVERKTVREGITSTASLIGLPLRETAVPFPSFSLPWSSNTAE